MPETSPADLEPTVIYSVGLCAMSVCSSEPIEAVVALANSQYPTGISSRWQPSDQPTFGDGQPNPLPCPDAPGRTHYLLEC